VKFALLKLGGVLSVRIQSVYKIPIAQADLSQILNAQKTRIWF